MSSNVLLELGANTAPVPAEGLGEDALTEAYLRLHLLCDLGNSICRHRDLDSLFSAVPPAVDQLVGAQRLIVAMADEQGGLCARICYGIDLPEQWEAWPVSRSILRRVLNEGISLLCEDAWEDDELSSYPSVMKHSIRSVLCVPIGTGSVCVGVIYADHQAVANRFSEMDLKFLTALSHYVALGIQNVERLQAKDPDAGTGTGGAGSLQEELYEDHQIIGSSPALLKAYEKLKRAAAKEVPVLLVGESGTGKELFAHAVHNLSPRATHPFVVVNLAEINENLFESELFGHEKGAFTGADRRKEGKLALAAGGTLFLDEIAEIPLHLQSKLLRVIETRSFERVGGTQRIEADFRLVCATHQDLAKRVKNGDFRDDLYYRLVGVTIELVPLRERVEDLPVLATHMLDRLHSSKTLTPQAIRHMQSYDWPGNIRQLVRVMEAIDALCESDEIAAADLPPPLHHAEEGEALADSGFAALKDVVTRAEKEHIRRALAIAKGNKTKARKMLGMTKDTFFRRLKEYQLT